MPTPDLTAARHDILIAINPELQLFPGELPDVDATDECWPVIEAVNRYCLTRGWEISYEHFPTIDGDYVVDVEIRQPLPEVPGKERQASCSWIDSAPTATDGALSLLARVATTFWEEREPAG